MDRAAFKKFRILPGLILFITILFAGLPCYADMTVEVSPNIINIDANRLGEIRVYTNLSYSTYRNCDVFIYVNFGPDSIENIVKTRDSLGNLILKFELEDLLALQDQLEIDAENVFDVAVVVDENTILQGTDSQVYIMNKKSP